MEQELNSGRGSYKWWILVTISAANFSAALDTSMITVGFPRLAEDFHIEASVVLSWHFPSPSSG
jgi:hypothetical protein